MTDNEQNQPYRTILNLWQWRTVRLTVYIFIIGAVILVVFPLATKYVLESWIVKHGADQAVIEDIDFNPFTGTASIEGVDVKIGGRTVIANADIDLNVSWLSLFQHQVTIQSAIMDGVQLEIKRLENGSWRIGGIIGKGAAETVEPAAAKKGEPWWVEVKELQLTNSEVRYISHDLSTTLMIETASIDNLFTGASKTPAYIHMRGQLDDAPVTIDIKLESLTPTIELEGKLNVTDLKLDRFAGLFKEKVEKLAGVAKFTGGFSFKSTPEQPIAVQYIGNFELDATNFAYKDMVFAIKNAAWEGNVLYNAGGEGQYMVGLNGNLSGRALDLKLPAQNLAVKQGELKVTGQTNIRIGSSIEATHSGDILLISSQAGSPQYTLNGNRIGWKGTIRYIGDVADDSQSVQLNGQLLSRVLKLDLPQSSLSVSQGGIDLEAKINLSLKGESFDIKGSANMESTETEVADYSKNVSLLSLARLNFKEAIAENKDKISIERVETGPLKVTWKRTGKIGMTLDAFSVDNVNIDELSSISVAGVNADKLQIKVSERNFLLAAIEKLYVETIQASRVDKVDIGQIKLGKVRLLSEPDAADKPPVTSIFSTHATKVNWDSKQGLAIDTVKLGGVNAFILRNKKGQLSVTQLLPVIGVLPKKESDSHERETIESMVKTEEAGAEPMTGIGIRLGEVVIGANSSMQFEDLSVDPEYRSKLNIVSLQVKGINTLQPAIPISINFDAKLGEYTTLKVDGAAKPFAYKIDLDADIDLKNLNMVPLSSYTIRMFGNVITSGQLNVVSTVHIANGSIDAMNTLRMNKLKVKKTSDEMAAAVENEMGMPLNKALSILQDKRGNIKLDVPIKGKLDEIEIGYGGIINKVLTKALITGTTSYLKYMFPTYGIAYTIAKKVGEEMTKIRIGPVIYEPGHAELTDAHEDFIKKIAKVMDERPQIEPQICGFMTEQDLLVVGGKKAREWYKQDDEGKQVLDIEAVSKDMKERVIILGYGRAKAIKDRLVSKYGIDPGRLYVCAPEYDNEADAKPRVELLI